MAPGGTWVKVPEPEHRPGANVYIGKAVSLSDSSFGTLDNSYHQPFKHVSFCLFVKPYNYRP